MAQPNPTPNWPYLYIPTATEWNDWWASKAGCVAVAVSAAGTVQASATPLVNQAIIVTACAPGAGVSATLMFHKVLNVTTTPCLFYPAENAQFWWASAQTWLATNAPVSIPGIGSTELYMISATQGYAL